MEPVLIASRFGSWEPRMERGAGSLELGAGGRDQNKSRSPPGGRRQPEAEPKANQKD